ncbi:methylhydantoinase [Saccharomonospora sp. CUA-673]|uniref:hydantoinase B/oxoprolinase family protein n=1 Tax=Saccharomonospora sp. CUA-673 TaxID=1904969 RepID=UPI000969F540|nr:hydantoinase B/oxoprolinase family protein [Saccharomonospora sp. CUA-673]OLT42360.1 methylhydantoinase [Saccharomonospora sp. CUA-673]
MNAGTEATVDPTTLAVVKGRLEQLVDEMDTVFERMAFSPVISDALDRANGLYRPGTGSMIVQGERGLPIFVGVMQFAVRAVADRIEEPRAGDVYLLNDPYLGGTHIMDVKMVRPFFYNGRLLCYLANTGHWPDIGGRVPGGFAAEASDVYQEGLRLPPVKIVDNDEVCGDIVEILKFNSRIPEDIEGDVDAQVSALVAGERRLVELIDEYGVDVIERCWSELEARAACEMRSYLAELPDGDYEFTEEMDNDGLVDEPLSIRVRASVRGDELTIDFAGSSPPCLGPMNSVEAATVSSAVVAIKHIFPDIALNSGMFEPLEVRTPTDTFLNAAVPRPVSGCAAETSQRIITAVMGALAQAAPDRVPAGSCATINNLSMGGIDDSGNPYVMYVFLGGGYGGHREGDGLSNGCSLMSSARTQSIEVTEQRYPVRFDRYALRDGSAGAGRYRGGFGVDYEFTFTGGTARASLLGDQSRTAPRGIAGGHAGSTASPYFVLDGEEVVLPMRSKGENVELRSGDRVRLRTPGGGGWGEPSERPPDDVAADVHGGYLTDEEADRDYRTRR